MKVVQINAVCGQGSTGKICLSISRLLDAKGIENYIIYSGKDQKIQNAITCASKYYIKIQALKSHLFGNYGFNSIFETKKIIAELNRISPKIVHLHNLHGHNCNLDILFKYLKNKGIKVYWTFHDCWAFTGYCTHYDMIGCDAWETECGKCPQRKTYSYFFDKSNALFHKKKQLFKGLDLTIITPSEWLADQVKKSFLKDYPIKVINNGIDLDVFSRTDNKKYDFNGKKVVLGVAFGWGERKGLDVFQRLAHDLDEKYCVVMVGTNKKIDSYLPDNVVSIHRTTNQSELASLYSMADVLVNPTREENFPTVHLEALACGTPVVSYDTGGCKEMLSSDTGIVVAKNDYEALLKAVKRVCEDGDFSHEKCRKQAEQYDQMMCFKKYIELYDNN